jgi:hypothetical protein
MGLNEFFSCRLYTFISTDVLYQSIYKLGSQLGVVQNECSLKYFNFMVESMYCTY